MKKEEIQLTAEDIELLKRIGGYLSHSTDIQTNMQMNNSLMQINNSLYKTPAQSLREQADYMEKKDKDISDFRNLLNKL